MPIYEFACQSCQAKFELRRSFGQADDPATCPQCQSTQAKRLLSTFACFSKGEGGATTAVGGSACGGCSATSCAGCGSH